MNLVINIQEANKTYLLYKCKQIASPIPRSQQVYWENTKNHFVKTREKSFAHRSGSRPWNDLLYIYMYVYAALHTKWPQSKRPMNKNLWVGDVKRDEDRWREDKTLASASPPPALTQQKCCFQRYLRTSIVMVVILCAFFILSSACMLHIGSYYEAL